MKNGTSKKKKEKQLRKLIEIQRQLDEEIFREKKIPEYPETNMRIALMVELGELMQEFQTVFKHWKSSAEDHRKKGLEEYVDCLHFALSLYYHGDKGKFVLPEYPEQSITERSNKKIYTCLISILDFCHMSVYDFALNELFRLGIQLGFTWEEVLEEYKKKNKVNHERINKGY